MVKNIFVKSCENKAEIEKVESFIMVIFGGAGDLSQKKLLPALFQLYSCANIQDFSIIATGRTKYTNEKFRKIVADHIKSKNKLVKKSDLKNFLLHLFYESCDISNRYVFADLYKLIDHHAEINETNNIIYYAAVPPSLIESIIIGLSEQRIYQKKYNCKIVLEKPFGLDKKSAMQLNRKLLQVFTEKQIYRIDHYLGKETVQNIIFFRYANTIFEPIWNHNYIDHVQITVAEDIGVENRGSFYEEAGVIRDIVQNHLMQLLAMIAMEAPAAFEADLIRNERVKVFQSIRQFNKQALQQNIVIGQYKGGEVNNKYVLGYREEKNVAKNSAMPTYFAAKFYIDNWRWSNVPFYVRAGKRLNKKETKIVIQFKAPPIKLLGRTCSIRNPNNLTIHIQPKEAISVQFCIKQPGTLNQSHSVNMHFAYDEFFDTKLLPAYTRLLLDCMKGDQTLFARADGIELMWGIVDPVIAELENKKEIKFYKAGSWGPKMAEELMANDGRRWLNE